jgi:hypothetical protein
MMDAQAKRILIHCITQRPGHATAFSCAVGICDPILHVIVIVTAVRPGLNRIKNALAARRATHARREVVHETLCRRRSHDRRLRVHKRIVLLPEPGDGLCERDLLSSRIDRRLRSRHPCRGRDARRVYFDSRKFAPWGSAAPRTSDSRLLFRRRRLRVRRCDAYPALRPLHNLNYAGHRKLWFR